MEVSFSDLKEKEIINIYDGKKLGHIVDILFDHETGTIQGVVVPGERKLFKKSDDIFIPLGKLKKIGDDVILVSLGFNRVGGQKTSAGFNTEDYQKRQAYSQNSYKNYIEKQKSNTKGQSQSNNNFQRSFVRYRPVNSRKYK